MNEQFHTLKFNFLNTEYKVTYGITPDSELNLSIQGIGNYSYPIGKKCSRFKQDNASYMYYIDGQQSEEFQILTELIMDAIYTTLFNFFNAIDQEDLEDEYYEGELLPTL